MIKVVLGIIVVLSLTTILIESGSRRSGQRVYGYSHGYRSRYRIGSRYRPYRLSYNNSSYSALKPDKHCDSGSCYLLYRMNLTQSDAMDMCERKGYKLIEIGSALESKLVTIISEYYGLNGYWVAGDDLLIPQTFLLPDLNVMKFSNWENKTYVETDRYETDNCIYANENGTWNTDDCKEKRSFICESNKNGSFKYKYGKKFLKQLNGSFCLAQEQKCFYLDEQRVYNPFTQGCQEHSDSHAVVIENEETHNLTVRLLNSTKNYTNSNVWIGSSMNKFKKTNSVTEFYPIDYLSRYVPYVNSQINQTVVAEAGFILLNRNNGSLALQSKTVQFLGTICEIVLKKSW